VQILLTKRQLNAARTTLLQWSRVDKNDTRRMPFCHIQEAPSFMEKAIEQSLDSKDGRLPCLSLCLVLTGYETRIL
jgi:hypothetical protein